MRANNIVYALLCFGFFSVAKGQMTEDLFNAQVGYAQLLGDKTLAKPRWILSSSVLGKYVVDLVPMFKASGVDLLDTDVVIYGPDAGLMYAKCSLKSIGEIKSICQTGKKSKSVYRVRIDDVVKTDSSQNPPISRLDVILVSGEPVSIKSGENPVTEVLLTEGVVSTDETQFEVKISGLEALMLAKIPDVLSCKVKLAEDGVLYDYPLKKSPINFLKIRLDRVVLDNSLKLQNLSPVEREQILSMIQSELKQIK